jgi:dienelactone hydrolase
MSDALSPSSLHTRLTHETQPALAYDGGPVDLWQGRLRAVLKELLGQWPEEACDLNARSVWRREHELGSIEKIVFTAEPYADVPCYLCLPKGKGPFPTFVCLQGHSGGNYNSIAVSQEDEETPIEVPGDRDFGLVCLRRGVAALCIEQRSFGERTEKVQEKRQDGCHEAAMHALMLGRTLAGERTYDVKRGIDYLATRPEVDMTRLGCMGNSGGGTITSYAAAMLPELRYAMPSCSFCTFRDSIMAIHHCSDNYIPRVLKYAEMADILGLFAPRKMVVVAGEQDEIFPISGVREAFADLKRIYQAAGAAENCRLVVGPEGHRFYGDLAWEAMLEMMD